MSDRGGQRTALSPLSRRTGEAQGVPPVPTESVDLATVVVVLVAFKQGVPPLDFIPRPTSSLFV